MLKHVENRWKNGGKHVENHTKRCGKHVEKHLEYHGFTGCPCKGYVGPKKV